MEWVYILLVCLAIGLVAYSAAFWGGVYRCLCFSEIMKMTIFFAVSQTALFWLGNWSGNSFANSLGWLSIPVAETIILLTGVKLVYGAIRVRPEQKSYNLARNGELIAVSFASSLNAFMIGLGMGLLRPLSIPMMYGILFVVAGMAVLGNFMGKKVGRIIYTKFAGITAGVLVAALAVLLGLDLYEMI